MPTLSQLSSLSRLAPLRRLPFWAQALALCALFAIAGVVVVDDYGVPFDENFQRRNAATFADYALGISEDPPIAHDRYYGVALEMPLLLVERALGLQDSRHIHLTRHMLTHLFFIAGGFACATLAYRMLGSRWIALLAMLMFLLHPRLYAHSFFNSKDVPFAIMLIVALYLAHRAFRKDTIGAFLLCGVGVGLAINLRVFGLMLPPMILAMRGLDLWQAGRGERKRILTTGAAFLGAAIAIVYIIHPYYWENPLRFIEGIRVLSQHPTGVRNLFMGEIYWSDAVPWNFIPVWFAITAPPVALLMGAIGCSAVCWLAITRPLAALRDRETRFRVMLLGCIALPVAIAIILQSNIYNDWRHMYFLWGPFCLLAVVGLRAIANICVEEGIGKIGARLPGWVRGDGLRMARRTLAYVVAGFGLITTLTAMAALHPHQQVYFNALVDTKTPGALGERYDMDYYQIAPRQALEYLLARYPDATLRVGTLNPNRQILPRNDRERIPILESVYAADFHLRSGSAVWMPPPNPREAGPYLHPLVSTLNMYERHPIYSVRAYDSPIALIHSKNVAAYRAAYADVTSNGDMLARADFDIYAYDGSLYYLSANCLPPALERADSRIFLDIIPEDPADLPSDSRERGYENRNFWLSSRAAFFDGKCMHRQPLPEYPIARIRTGQFVSGNAVWRADINIAARAAAAVIYDGILAGDYGPPVAQSDFDLYLRDNGLAYLKEPCVPGDADARFFLHITPADPADLPAVWRERGFVNLDFQFTDHGAAIDDICVVAPELPRYPVDRVHTGQFVSGEGVIWRADIDLAARALHESIAAGDFGKPVAQSHFDVYIRDGVLAYIKEPCAASDTDARFFLHITPADPADLPAASREFGFANLDFRFADHGADIGGKCVAERKLPDYAIDLIRTGQKASAPGDVEWRADIDLAARAAAQAVHDRILAGDYGPPVAQSRFDLYLRDNALTYLKENCDSGDTDARFFLHIIPADLTDLPTDSRERGFANLDFRFADRGARAGDICVAERVLPGYAVARIRTGQFVRGEGQLWSAEFPAAR